jgi:hypothetical protein
MILSYQIPLVVVRFKGGLANQLYQLAAGLDFSSLCGARLAYSDCYYRHLPNPRCLIAPSIYDGQLFEYKESLIAFCWGQFRRRTKTLKSLWQHIDTEMLVVTDENVSTIMASLAMLKSDPTSLVSPKVLVLDGYFHNYQTLLSSGLLDRLSIFSGSPRQGIGVHIRLGDYLKYPYCNFYRLVDCAYIVSAYRALLEAGASEDLPLHIFSDSPQEAYAIVKEALPNASIHIEPGRSPISDLRELSSFQYQILSNSSFSLLSWHLSTPSVATIPAEWFKSSATNELQFSPSTRLIRISSSSRQGSSYST